MAKKPAAITARLAGEPVHVVEQVEGVRHARPARARRSGSRARVQWTICTDVPVDRTIAAAPSWAASFQRAAACRCRRSRPARKRRRCTGEDADELRRRRERPEERRRADTPPVSADVDRDAADERRGRRPPARRSGTARGRARSGIRSRSPHHESAMRERDDGRDGAHGMEGSGAVLGLCLPAQAVPTLVRDR